MKVILISVDNHTLGIQTVATMVAGSGGEPILFYLPSNLRRYPKAIEDGIMQVLRKITGEERSVLIGFHLKELSYSRAVQLVQAVRTEFGNRAILVAGGTYATSMKEELLSDFDHVVVGDGEGIIPIIKSMETCVSVSPMIESPPRMFRYPLYAEAHVLDENGQINRRHTRPLVHPQYKHRQNMEIMLESGCGYACSFCEVATLREMFGSAYRILQSDPVQSINIIREQLGLSPGIEYVYFFDEDFLLKSEEWISTFAAEYASIGLPFFIFATPRSISKGKRKLSALANVGLDTVNVGVQTGSPRIARDLFGRKEDRAEITDVLDVLTSLYRNGRVTSPPMTDWIILNPYEKKEDMSQTIKLMQDMPLPFNAVMHCMNFFRGTPLYKKALAEGVIPPEYRFRFDLHDFLNRVGANEFGLDFTSRSNLEWLKYNTILAGMKGLHTIKGATRYFGSINENDLPKYLETEMSIKEIAELAASFPNPMDECLFPWEQEHAHQQTKGGG
ncbi:MAG: radical SAM protein [bacterium]|nr:radical SAM protein [bacterium]